MEENRFNAPTEEVDLPKNRFEVTQETKNNNNNNCNGHFTSISAGGRGHKPGDSCGCDEGPSPVPIDKGIGALFIIAVLIITLINKIRQL